MPHCFRLNILLLIIAKLAACTSLVEAAAPCIHPVDYIRTNPVQQRANGAPAVRRQEDVTRIFLVRHAEKAMVPTPPYLSGGKAVPTCLPISLRNCPWMLFSLPNKRTQETALPVAQKGTPEVEGYKTGRPLLSPPAPQTPGQSVLVVGYRTPHLNSSTGSFAKAGAGKIDDERGLQQLLHSRHQ